jgi:hypothetical protein
MSRASGRINADGLIGGDGCILAYSRAAASAGHVSPDKGILLDPENLMMREVSSSPFVYRPLDGPSAIRLLVLHPPGSPCESLRGTIQNTTISERSYEAISYTWGDDSKPCSILLDGCRMLSVAELRRCASKPYYY